VELLVPEENADPLRPQFMPPHLDKSRFQIPHKLGLHKIFLGGRWREGLRLADRSIIVLFCSHNRIDRLPAQFMPQLDADLSEKPLRPRFRPAHIVPDIPYPLLLKKRHGIRSKAADALKRNLREIKMKLSSAQHKEPVRFLFFAGDLRKRLGSAEPHRYSQTQLLLHGLFDIPGDLFVSGPVETPEP